LIRRRKDGIIAVTDLELTIGGDEMGSEQLALPGLENRSRMRPEWPVSRLLDARLALIRYDQRCELPANPTHIQVLIGNSGGASVAMQGARPRRSLGLADVLIVPPGRSIRLFGDMRETSFYVLLVEAAGDVSHVVYAESGFHVFQPSGIELIPVVASYPESGLISVDRMRYEATVGRSEALGPALLLPCGDQEVLVEPPECDRVLLCRTGDFDDTQYASYFAAPGERVVITATGVTGSCMIVRL
jgi:hypothetical protein